MSTHVQNHLRKHDQPRCPGEIIMCWYRTDKSLKSSSFYPGVRPGASRQFVAGGPELTGTIREENRVRSYILGIATD